MNERIKELAVKSGGFRDEGERLVSRFIEDTDMSDEIQDFADLIIKECLDILEKERHNTNVLLSKPEQSSAVLNAKWKIEKHFWS